MTRPAAILLRGLMVACAITAARAQDSTPAKAPAPGGDLALFANGDTLSGHLEGCDKEGLHWRTAYDQSILVPTKRLTRILLQPHAPPDTAAKFSWSAQLVNGDILPGSPISLDDKTLVLDTWYAGKLSIPRAMLAAIGKAGFPYSGPTGLDGWVLTPDDGTGWTYADGAFSTPSVAAIGRPIRFPIRTSIQFDLDPGASWLDVYLGFDQTGKIGRSYLYELNFGSQAAYINLFQYDSGVQTRIGQVSEFKTGPGNDNSFQLTLDHGASGLSLDNATTPLATKEKLHFEIRIDKKAGTLAMIVNGKQARLDTGLSDLSDLGGSLIFSPGRNAAPLMQPAQPMLDFSNTVLVTPHSSTVLARISGIQVGIWNDGPQPAGGAGEGVDLENGDSLPGKIASIADGKLNIVSQNTPSTVPLENIGAIYFAPPPADAPHPAASSVRATLDGGALVSLEFAAWADGRATVTSPDFSEATFVPGAFQILEFNHAGDAKPAVPSK